MVYTVCIGNSERRKDSSALARKGLSELFPDVRFPVEADIQPLFFRRQASLTDQVARFTFDCGVHEAILYLEGIEQKAGRISGEKKQEIICLDIDLLSRDNRVYKPEDLKRDYVVCGPEELNEEMQLNRINKAFII